MSEEKKVAKTLKLVVQEQEAILSNLIKTESVSSNINFLDNHRKLELEMKNQNRPSKEKEALDQARLFFFAWPTINLYFERNLTKPLLRIRDPLHDSAHPPNVNIGREFFENKLE